GEYELGGQELPGELFESHELAGEQLEMELAAELLEVSTEAELEQFLGKLVRAAAGAARNFAGSATGRAVGGILKRAAKQALPQLGQALGGAIHPDLGANGRRLGTFAAGRLELETEGLSAEDREFEAARAFVRFGTETARRAAAAPSGEVPQVVAQRAAMAAAQRHAPGLVRAMGSSRASGAASGRWIRRGNRIVLFGV
ncbi:MAG: hypothetical protein AB7O92_32725, partial [Acidimicrobiia bacterium]